MIRREGKRPKLPARQKTYMGTKTDVYQALFPAKSWGDQQPQNERTKFGVPKGGAVVAVESGCSPSEYGTPLRIY